MWGTKMRKILIALLLVCIITLSSCSSGVDAAEYLSLLDGKYSVNATITEDGTEYTVRMSREADGEFKVVFAQPDVLWGMGYGFDGEDSYLIYNDMSIALQDSILETGAATGIYRWRKLMSTDGEFGAKRVSVDGVQCIMLEDGERKIYFTENDKKLYKLEGGNTNIVFAEFIGNGTGGAETEGVGTDRAVGTKA